MYKYTQTEFVAMMDELMDKFKKGCQKSDAELEAAYKILNPAPVGGFIDSLVKMDKYYGTDLWEIKRKQIKCFISKCDRYELTTSWLIAVPNFSRMKSTVSYMISPLLRNAMFAYLRIALY